MFTETLLPHFKINWWLEDVILSSVCLLFYLRLGYFRELVDAHRVISSHIQPPMWQDPRWGYAYKKNSCLFSNYIKNKGFCFSLYQQWNLYRKYNSMLRLWTRTFILFVFLIIIGSLESAYFQKVHKCVRHSKQCLRNQA